METLWAFHSMHCITLHWLVKLWGWEMLNVNFGIMINTKWWRDWRIRSSFFGCGFIRLFIEMIWLLFLGPCPCFSFGFFRWDEWWKICIVCLMEIRKYHSRFFSFFGRFSYLIIFWWKKLWNEGKGKMRDLGFWFKFTQPSRSCEDEDDESF